MTRVYLQPQRWMGKGIQRVAQALAQHAPDEVLVVSQREHADLEVVHVVGCGSLPKDLGARPYAVVQYCYRTTEQPTAEYWLPVWQGARAVWSYYDLPRNGYRLVYQPLGVDPAVFCVRRDGPEREYVIATHGYVASTEAVQECHAAAKRLELPAAHLGPRLQQAPGDTYHNMVDEDVAALWSRCERVAALRRVEGFELPGVEGLLCGARPVAFDAPHYRAWYGTHAEYVPEVDAPQLTEALVALLQAPPQPVSKYEQERVREVFHWPTLCGNFWEEVLQ